MQNKKQFFPAFISTLVALFVVTSFVFAITTISTNVSTDGTLTVVGNATFDNNTLFMDATNNKVGIGTTNPQSSLHLIPATAAALQLDPFGASAGNSAELRFLELAANGTNYIGFKSPDSITSNVIWTLPNADGTSNQLLQTDGSGILSWTTVSAQDSDWTISGNDIFSANTGNVGIGTTGGFSDAPVKLVDPATLPTGQGRGVSFSPDGTYLAIGHSTTPFVTIYKRSGDTFTKLANPATLPTGQGKGPSFSPDGTYLAIGHDSSPFVTIYKRSGDTFTKLANPATLPTGNGEGAAFSPDGTYLAVVHNSSPFVTIYKRSGDTFTKLANPATLPTGNGEGAAFSPDGTYLAVGHAITPFVTIYKRSGDTFTKLANPATLPNGNVWEASFSPDGTYLAVGNGGSIPNITIYKRSGDIFTKLADPATLPPNTDVRGAAFSPDGTYLAFGFDSSPFITIYKRSGDTFTKLADPATLPANAGRSAAFSPDGTYLAVGHAITPFITIYKGGGSLTNKFAITTHATSTGGLAFGKEIVLHRSGPGTLGLSEGNSLDIKFGTLRINGTEVLDSQRNAFLERITSTGTAPALSSCGTSPSITGTDTAGKVTIGSGATTSCTVTFTAFTNAPSCTVTGDNNAIGYAGTTSATALTITSSADMASDVINYICIGL